MRCVTGIAMMMMMMIKGGGKRGVGGGGEAGSGGGKGCEGERALLSHTKNKKTVTWLSQRLLEVSK